MLSIEKLLKGIAPDYYTTSEYETGIENFINEAERNHRDLKDYCIEALSNNYFGATQYRKVVICYLLLDPTGKKAKSEHFRFIDMLLYQAFKEDAWNYNIQGITPEEVLYVLKKRYRHEEGYEDMVEEINDFYGKPTTAMDDSPRIMGEHINIDKHQWEWFDAIIKRLEKAKHLEGNYDSGFIIPQCSQMSKTGLVWLLAPVFDCGTIERDDKIKLNPSNFPKWIDNLFGNLNETKRKKRIFTHWDEFKDFGREFSKKSN